MVGEPQPIPVGQEPPPMHRLNGATPTRHQDKDKAKGPRGCPRLDARATASPC